MRTAAFTIVAALVVLGTQGVNLKAGKMNDSPDIKQWDSIIGEWDRVVEYRESPDGEWKRTTEKLRFAWVMDGAFVKITGSNQDGVSFEETSGYDPLLKMHYSVGFNNLGASWTVTSGNWNGNTYVANWTAVSPGGVRTPGICTFKDNADFTKAEGECQSFSNGKWWVDRKLSDTKVK